MGTPKDRRTIAAANGVGNDMAFGAVVPPLYLSSTFAFADFGRNRGYDYSRTANPTRDLLGDTLAKLECGAGAVVVSSGMAAIDLVLAQLKPDDLIIAPHDCYGGTYRLLKARSGRGHFIVEFVDESDDEAISVALDKVPSLILVETPSNPRMRVVDIRKIVTEAKSVGAVVAVDNTFLSPALQQPIALGADYAIHSTTKYLNGHSDVVGGAVISAKKDDAEALSDWANITGVTGAPFDAYLTLRGLRTLFPRVERQQATAAKIADFLEQEPSTTAVHYPGLHSHPGYSLAKAQQAGSGAMLSFELRGGIEAVIRFIGALRVFTLAESLGGVESLVCHPASMTHAGMAPEAQRAAGIGDNLIRLSIGLEAENDLIVDLQAGFAAAVRAA